MTPPTFTFPGTLPDRGERLPVTLVTGFLGSGKTTLLNHILSNRVGVKAAVLVNELGEIGIDGDLIEVAEGGMIELANGCICCSTNSDLVDGIVRILSRPEPADHLLVETTGVADPLPVAQTFLRPEFRDALRLDAIIAVTDAEHFSLELFQGTAACDQLRHADAILVNKCDRVDEQRLGSVEGQIRSVNGGARLIRTTQSAAPLSLILDVELFKPAPGDHHGHHTHLGDDGFVSIAFESDRPFSVHRFQAFLDERPQGLFRGKGFLQLAETGRRYIFHLVGGHFTLEVDERPAGKNCLVLIGRQLDVENIRSRLFHCLAD